MVGFIVLLPPVAPICISPYFLIISIVNANFMEFSMNETGSMLLSKRFLVRSGQTFGIQIIVINAVITSFLKIKIKIETNFLSLALSLSLFQRGKYIPSRVVDRLFLNDWKKLIAILNDSIVGNIPEIGREEIDSQGMKSGKVQRFRKGWKDSKNWNSKDARKIEKAWILNDRQLSIISWKSGIQKFKDSKKDRRD